MHTHMSFVTFFYFFSGSSKYLSIPSSISDRTRLAIDLGLPSLPSSLELSEYFYTFYYYFIFYFLSAFSFFTFFFLGILAGGGGGAILDTDSFIFDYFSSELKNFFIFAKIEEDYFFFVIYDLPILSSKSHFYMASFS